MTIKITLEGEDALNYLNGRVFPKAEPAAQPTVEKAEPRKPRKPTVEKAAEAIGQPELAKEPASAPKPPSDSDIVRAYAAKFGTPALVAKLGTAKAKRVTDLTGDDKVKFLAELQAALA